MTESISNCNKKTVSFWFSGVQKERPGRRYSGTVLVALKTFVKLLPITGPEKFYPYLDHRK